MPHANKLTIHILAAVAEHEREAISARTKAALAAAKARGKQLGGPKLDEARIKGRAALRANADRFAGNTMPIIKQIQASGVSNCAASQKLSPLAVCPQRGAGPGHLCRCRTSYAGRSENENCHPVC